MTALCVASPINPRTPSPYRCGRTPKLHRGSLVSTRFAILLQGEADVQAWADRLDSLGVKHSPVIEATIGWILSFHDPDGLELRFYTSIRHGADVSGQAGYGRAAHPSPHAR